MHYIRTGAMHHVSPFAFRVLAAIGCIFSLLAAGLPATNAMAEEEAKQTLLMPGPVPPEGWKPDAVKDEGVPTIAEPVANQQELEARVVKRWEAMAKRDFDEAYTYETPSYRSLYSAEQFKGLFGGLVTWYGARVLRVENLGNGVASVIVKVRFKATVPGINADFGIEESARPERWVVEEGTWFHVTE